MVHSSCSLFVPMKCLMAWSLDGRSIDVLTQGCHGKSETNSLREDCYRNCRVKRDRISTL